MRNLLQKNTKSEAGMTLVGLILVLALIGLILLVVAQVTPTVIEYMTIKKAIQSVKTSGGSVRDMQMSFDKQADVGYVTSISGKDLVIEKNGSDIEVSFAYTRKIPLIGPASLLLEYEGTTAKKTSAPKKAE